MPINIYHQKPRIKKFRHSKDLIRSNHVVLIPRHKMTKNLIEIIREVLKIHHYFITYHHAYELKKILENDYQDGLSGIEIQKKYELKQHSNITMFLKSLNIITRNNSEAIRNYHHKNGMIPSEKDEYKKSCAFDFDPYSNPNVSSGELSIFDQY